MLLLQELVSQLGITFLSSRTQLTSAGREGYNQLNRRYVCRTISRHFWDLAFEPRYACDEEPVILEF